MILLCYCNKWWQHHTTLYCLASFVFYKNANDLKRSEQLFPVLKAPASNPSESSLHQGWCDCWQIMYSFHADYSVIEKKSCLILKWFFSWLLLREGPSVFFFIPCSSSIDCIYLYNPCSIAVRIVSPWKWTAWIIDIERASSLGQSTIVHRCISTLWGGGWWSFLRSSLCLYNFLGGLEVWVGGSCKYDRDTTHPEKPLF